MSSLVARFKRAPVTHGAVLVASIFAANYVYSTLSSDKEEKSNEPAKSPELKLRIEKESNIAWDEELDVVIVGSGAAGASAAVKASITNPKASIAVLEKCHKEWGGTTKKSGGIFWIPNNRLMEQDDPREDCIMHMAEQGFPEFFDINRKYYGLPKLDYERLEKFYDTGHVMVDEMVDIGLAPYLSRFTKNDGNVMHDYSFHHEKRPNNKAPRGRGLGLGDVPQIRSFFSGLAATIDFMEPAIRYAAKFVPEMKDLLLVNNFGIDLSYGVGPRFVGQYENYIKDKCKNVKIRMGNAVEGIVTDDSGKKVVGVIVRKNNNEVISIKTNKGVIFATGGFSMNQEMLKDHLPGDVYQTGACKHATGDFHKLAMLLDADMVRMDKIWGCETHLEEALKSWETETCIFHMRGDSYFVVNAKGNRVYNEKGAYDKRARVHWAKPENKFLMLIGDHRCADTWGAAFGKTWPPNLNDPMYVKGKTIPELAQNLKKRFDKLRNTKLSKSVGNFTLDATFEGNLEKTLAKFNDFAKEGVDKDWDRGAAPSEREWTHSPNNPFPNNTMHPLDVKDGFYCLILASSVIDTKGGVGVSVDQQVLRNGKPIPGLYAAGNACAPTSGDAYWSGGTTLGTAMVGGWLAGEHIMKN